MVNRVGEMDKIIGELMLYVNPELLKDGFKNELKKGENYNRKKTEKYFALIISVSWFLKKIKKYRLYFLYFYPRSKRIKGHEALEHHIHSYIEDLETLRNKLKAYVGELKNDLKKIASNKKEVENKLKNVIAQIYRAFSNVSKNRNPHRHSGKRFTDKNIMRAESASFIIEYDFLRRYLTDSGLKKFQEEMKESFKKAKGQWSIKAIGNYEQILGLTDTIFRMTKKPLYKLLDIQPSISQ